MSYNEIRCRCGRLLARAVREVVEFKCPRCKRIVLLAEGKLFYPQGKRGDYAPCRCGLRRNS